VSGAYIFVKNAREMVVGAAYAKSLMRHCHRDLTAPRFTAKCDHYPAIPGCTQFQPPPRAREHKHSHQPHPYHLLFHSVNTFGPEGAAALSPALRGLTTLTNLQLA
jgi:hypothetical protein